MNARINKRTNVIDFSAALEARERQEYEKAKAERKLLLRQVGQLLCDAGFTLDQTREIFNEICRVAQNQPKVASGR